MEIKQNPGDLGKYKKKSPSGMPELEKELKPGDKGKINAGAEDEDLGDEGPYAGRDVSGAPKPN